MSGSQDSDNWNENNLNPLSRINWRASLVPAAAVIPAPIAYIKVVAVKKLVVGLLVEGVCLASRQELYPIDHLWTDPIWY